MPTEAPDDLQYQANAPALTLNDLLTRTTPEAIVQMAWSHDGSILAVGYESGLIDLWDTGKHQAIRDLWDTGKHQVVRDLWDTGKHQVSRDRAIGAVRGTFAWRLLSRRLAWVSREGLRITDLDLDTGSSKFPGTDAASSVCWSPDSTRLFFGTRQGRLAVLDESTGVIEPIANVASAVTAVSWPQPNRLLALISDGWLLSYSLQTRDEVALDIEGVTSVAVSRDGNTIAAGTHEGRIRMWTPGQEESGTSGDLLGHSGPIRDLSFSSDGTLLASKASDQRVIIWQLAPPGAVAMMEEHPSWDKEGLLFWSSAIAFSPTEPLLATSAQTVRLWNIDAKLLTPLHVEEPDLATGTSLEPGEARAPGLGTGRTRSASISRSDFYVHAPAATAGRTFTAKSADSYLVVLRGGVQVKERAHESVLAFLAEHLRTNKVSIANPHPIDLLMYEPAYVIFEVKRVGNRHPGHAIREAVGQLLEYRYFIGPRGARLCVVLDASPRDPGLVEFVEKELGMLLLWITEKTVSGGPLTTEFFSSVGVNVAS